MSSPLRLSWMDAVQRGKASREGRVTCWGLVLAAGVIGRPKGRRVQ